MVSRVFLCILALAPLTGACFNDSIGCPGPTPHHPPDQWYLLFQRNMQGILAKNPKKFVPFTDKVLFKEYCKQKNVPVLESIAVFDHKDWAKIDFSKLPSNMVIKANKGSGWNIIVRDGIPVGLKNATPEKAIKFIRERIRHWGGPFLDPQGRAREYWYELMEPKILIEPLMSPVPDDIRLFVLNNSHVDLIQISTSGPRHNFYDAELNRLPYHRIHKDNFEGPSVVDVIKTPEKIAEMHRIALMMAADTGLDAVRIDLYHINDTFYGSEITLTPAKGAYNIVPGKYVPGKY